MFAETDASAKAMRVSHTSRGMWVSMVTQDAIVQSLFQVYIIIIYEYCLRVLCTTIVYQDKV